MNNYLARLLRAVIILAILAGISACVSSGVKPEDCPAGTQKLANCPPLAAVSDPEILDLYDGRTWIDPSDLEEDAVEYGRDLENRTDDDVDGSIRLSNAVP